MRAVKGAFVLATVVVFGCLLLFDTTALLRLAGMCLAGDCGVPSSWIAAAVAAMVAAVVAHSLWRRRRGASRQPGRGASRKPARGASRKPANRSAAGPKAAGPKRPAPRPRRSSGKAPAK